MNRGKGESAKRRVSEPVNLRFSEADSETKGEPQKGWIGKWAI